MVKTTKKVFICALTVVTALLLVACKKDEKTYLPGDIDRDATYNAVFGKTYDINPFTSSDANASDIFDLISSPLYSTDYDWYNAVKKGIAAGEFDFSKIASGEYTIESLGYKYVLNNAAKYPFAITNGTDYTNDDGEVDQALSKASLDTKWQIELKQDLEFENGVKINADTFVYSVKQQIDPKLLNFRANLIYSGNYLNMKNAEKYYKGEVTNFEDVGIKKISEYVIEIELNSEASQWTVMSMVSMMYLVEQTAFERGLNDQKTQTTYGSVDNMALSYGPYRIVNWNPDTEVVFERRENFHLVENYNFKIINGRVIESPQTIVNEFNAGNLDYTTASGEFWEQFKDHPGLYLTPSSSFYRLDISIERPAGNPNGSVSPLLYYTDFRTALYLATDREDFAANVQAPSTALSGYVSGIHKVSEESEERYHDSSQHYQVLDELGLSPDSAGYNADEAVRLFNLAYDQAVADGRIAQGAKVVLTFTYYDAGSNPTIATWLQSQYQRVFGEDKFELRLEAIADQATFESRRGNGDFDLLFTGLSGGTFDVIFLYDYVYGQQAFHYGNGFELVTKEVSAAIPNLFEILRAKPATELKDDEVAFLAAVDNAGVFHGTFEELAALYTDTIAFSAEYEGRTEDLSNMAAAMERVLLEEGISVPLFSSVSAVVYSDRVELIAPAWQSFMSWGGWKYRYIKKAA